MRDSLAEGMGSSSAPSSSSSRPDRTTGSRSAGLPLESWLRANAAEIADHWRGEVVRRAAVQDDELLELLGRFFGFVTRLLPHCVGPERGPAMEVWSDGAQLYGSLCAVRGLAAGEVVEEFQILRESLLRKIFGDPPIFERTPLKLRDAVQLNRVIDAGVTQASVSHTDQLFYQLLESNGVPATATPELLAEICEQLTQLEEEAGAL